MVFIVDNLNIDDEEPRTGIYVTELTDHDVLLGRGTGPSSNAGNVSFRLAVEEMKASYISTPSRKAKNRLVRKTVEAIKAKNGRFLNKLRKSECKMLGMSTQKPVYEVVHDSVACEKTKQAIRYVHYKKDPKTNSSTTAMKKKRTTVASATSGETKAEPARKKAKTSPPPSPEKTKKVVDLKGRDGQKSSGRETPESPTLGSSEATLAQILLATNTLANATPQYSPLASLTAVPKIVTAAPAPSLNALFLKPDSPILGPAPAGLGQFLLARGGYPVLAGLQREPMPASQHLQALAQYHHAMRQHTSSPNEILNLLLH